MSKPAIAILGGGPSGLLLGRLLRLANIPSTIFERDTGADATFYRRQEGTLDIHRGTGQRALGAAGLLPQFKARARHNQTTTLADPQGKIYAQFGAEDDRPVIDRKDLLQLLLGSLAKDQVQWGRRVQSLQREETSGTTALHFEDGTVADGFRLVVGADGAWSKVRQLVTDATPAYSGLSFLTSYVSPESPLYQSVATLVGEGKYMAFGDGKLVSIQKLGDGGYYYAVGLRLAADWAHQNPELLEHPSILQQRLMRDHDFASWAEIHRKMIKHVERPFRQWPLHAMPIASLAWKTVPGLALIGDAAHVTTPFAGGENCALNDSLELAQQLSSHGLEHIDQAVAAYEKEMFPRAMHLIQRSEQNGKLLFAPDAPLGFLRSHGIDV